MSSKYLGGSVFILVCILAYVSLVAIPEEAIKTNRMELIGSPADVDLAYDNIIIKPIDTDIRIAGWWIPAEKPEAVIVFVHGAGANRTSTFFKSLDFYRAMVDRNIAIVAIDLRNHGESGSHNAGLQFGRTERHDAEAAIAWARQKAPELPVYAMGISMGGATIIQAAYYGTKPDGLILLDALLDSVDTFKQGGWINTGLPAIIFAPSAWSATTFFGLPPSDEQGLELASKLELPILVIQDPDDPVTRTLYAEQLAGSNPQVKLWLAPKPTADQQADLQWKGRWGTHVAAFALSPAETVQQITAFIHRHSGR
jgi:pimeloyl-ACP methyl ester carboxylesterase